MTPSRSPRVCNKSGCGKPTQSRYCEEHTEEKARYEREKDRAAGPRPYDSQRWRKYRRWFLNQPENRICKCGCGRMATEVDHIIPAKAEDPLFWDYRNHAGMTHECHSRKTMRELRARQKVEEK